jgi:hypothetical protein
MPNRLIVVGTPPLGRVPLLDPAGDSLIEHSEIAVSQHIELLVGQTGQLMGTGSVEDDDAVAWNVTRLDLYVIDGN